MKLRRIYKYCAILGQPCRLTAASVALVLRYSICAIVVSDIIEIVPPTDGQTRHTHARAVNAMLL